MFQTHQALGDRATIWKVRGTFIWCDDRPWSCEVGTVLSLVFHGMGKNDRSRRHPPPYDWCRIFYFFLLLSKCSIYRWIEIHVALYRYNKLFYLDFNSHLSQPHDSSLSPLYSLPLLPHIHVLAIIPHLFLTPVHHTSLPPANYLHQPHFSPFSSLSSLSTRSPLLLPSSARNRCDQQAENPDQSLCAGKNAR